MTCQSLAFYIRTYKDIKSIGDTGTKCNLGSLVFLSVIHQKTLALKISTDQVTSIT